jgi:hypothetical protein
MKKITLLLIIFTILFSCKKDNTTSDLRNKIIGAWELERNLCGECITPVGDFPTGNGNIIVLSANGEYERKKHDTVLFVGTYTLQKKKDCFQRSSDVTFSTNENPNPVSYGYISVENGKLIFNTPNCFADGSTNIYRRIE